MFHASLTFRHYFVDCVEFLFNEFTAHQWQFNLYSDQIAKYLNFELGKLVFLFFHQFSSAITQ